jgi:SAM-dependent methyltransferase
VPDVYATITEADAAVLARLAEILELRAAEPQQVAIRDAYLDDVGFPDGARVLEAGCGTGAVSRAIAVRPEVAAVVASDPSPFFLARGRELAAEIDNLSFVEADARELPFDDETFDAVVFHTALCHIPGPSPALEEAHRVLRRGGRVVVFDGDYETTTVARAEADPLEACVRAAVLFLVHDRFLVRRLPALVADAGFEPARLRSHGYVEAPTGGYMLALVERGIDALAADGTIGHELSLALKGEALRRSDEREFFGHIAYASAIAAKP